MCAAIRSHGVYAPRQELYKRLPGLAPEDHTEIAGAERDNGGDGVERDIRVGVVGFDIAPGPVDQCALVVRLPVAVIDGVFQRITERIVNGCGGVLVGQQIGVPV